MSSAPQIRSAVVADGRPLGRNLVRFLLEEHGYDIVAEAATAFDTVRAASEHRPDLIVVHENCVAPESRFGIARVRGASPASRIVVVVGRRAAVHAAYGGAADAIVEEGPGLQALGLALEGDDEPEAAPFARASEPPVVVPFEERSDSAPRGRWLERLQGAAAAAIFVVALVLARGIAPTTPGGTPENEPERGHLSVAFDSLRELAEEASTADQTEVISLARELIAERAIAEASGLDVSELDLQIRSLLEPLLPSLPSGTVEALLAILGPLVGGDPPASVTPEITPTRSPSPQPPAEPEPGPTPTETETVPPPTPSEPPTPSPSPTETGTPSPTDTGTSTPSPTETGTPTPTDTGTPSPTDTGTPTPTDTGTPTPSPTETGTPSPTDTGTPTPTDTGTPTPTDTGTPTPTDTGTPTPTDTGTPTPTDTGTPTPTDTDTPSPTDTDTPSPTETGTPSPSDPGEPEPSTTDTSTTDQTDTPDASDAGTAGSAAIVIIPPAGILLMLTSAIARRRYRRG